MFDGAESFNQPLDTWDVRQVIDMGSMFAEATSFNQSLGMWALHPDAYLYALFHGAVSMRQARPVQRMQWTGNLLDW
eukprot:gene36898-biopygen34414